MGVVSDSMNGSVSLVDVSHLLSISDYTVRYAVICMQWEGRLGGADLYDEWHHF